MNLDDNIETRYRSSKIHPIDGLIRRNSHLSLLSGGMFTLFSQQVIKHISNKRCTHFGTTITVFDDDCRDILRIVTRSKPVNKP